MQVVVLEVWLVCKGVPAFYYITLYLEVYLLITMWFSTNSIILQFFVRYEPGFFYTFRSLIFRGYLEICETVIFHLSTLLLQFMILFYYRSKVI